MQIINNNSDLLMRLMSASVTRSRAIASNLANQNVPGYKRQEVNFESLVSAELERGANSETIANIDVQLTVDETTPGRADGNNVSVENEVAMQKENLLRFRLWSTLVQGRTRLLESAINGDR